MARLWLGGMLGIYWVGVIDDSVDGSANVGVDDCVEGDRLSVVAVG